MSILRNKVNKMIENIKKGKPDALKELHTATFGHLQIVAFNYLSDHNDIDDVLSETYIKVYKYVNSAKADQDGYNWLCKIVQNLCYDYNARRGVTDFTDRLSQHKLFYDIEETLIEYSQLYAAIAKLDASDQKIIYLKHWEDKSFQEIAEKLNVKKSTVYVRYSKIIAFLKKELS
ncbi:MAG: sigma-70 family RNA polymerase sigma factor, partial [Clostridia bacterium]|nr:sigma-70 family RNA polymerase sigma factor [Clostridia bacterium]